MEDTKEETQLGSVSSNFEDRNMQLGKILSEMRANMDRITGPVPEKDKEGVEKAKGESSSLGKVRNCLYDYKELLEGAESLLKRLETI